MKAFVEKADGEFRNVNGYVAWQGLVERGCEVEFFEAAQVDDLALTPRTPVVAGILVVHRALRRLGCEPPALEPIPHQIQAYAGRDFGISTLGEARRKFADGCGPLFIKPPAGQSKIFNGHVIAAFRDLIATSHLPDEQMVWWSQAVEFRAEFRGFVHRGELIGFRHYYGNFRLTVDFGKVEKALGDWTNKPIGCSMDWGVTKEGRTLLIEVNEGHSLGCYGLASHLYAPLLIDRWLEMTAAAD
jgi:hypothetical protein